MTDRALWYRNNDFRSIEGYKRITVDEICDEGAINLYAAIVKSAVDEYKKQLMTLFLRGISFEDANPSDEVSYDSLIKGKHVKCVAKKEAWAEYQKWLEDKKNKKQRYLHKTHAKKPHKCKYIRDDEPDYIYPIKAEGD